ncbi:MAG: putative Ig domain-containing protein, partial [Acidobacteriota bacterium]|nr:putative Ig domain-containing protein [Acidobacteriota bacterium]
MKRILPGTLLLLAFFFLTVPVSAQSLQITSTSPLPSGEVGVSYSFQFATSGGPDSAIIWSSPSRPPGLSLNQDTGLLQGTPTSAFTNFSFTVTAADVNGQQSTSKTFTFTASPAVSISSTSPLPSADLNTPYSFSFQATGGQSPYSWGISSGVPPGLSINSGGILSGSPTSTGSFGFSVTVHDYLGGTSTTFFQIVVNPDPLIISSSPLPAAETSAPYSFQFAGTGGSGLYTWSVAPENVIPQGLALSSGGLLSGTPVTPQTASFGILLTDSAGGTTIKNFTLPIAAGPAITSTSPLPAGTVGSAYSFTFRASSGSGSYTWSLASGSLPAGLSLGTATGTLSGTPSSPGTSSFGIAVHDSSGGTANGSFALTINSGLSIISTSPLTSGEVSRPYSFTFSGSGGSGSYTWSLPSGSIPPAGLTLNSGGTLSGTPTTAGTSSFLVQIADGSGSTATKNFQLQIVATPSITTTSPLPAGTVNSAYGPLTFTESGGIGPFVWTSSSLPAGLSLTSGGVLSGTPTSAGTSRIPVTLTDAAGGTASAFFSLTVVSTLAVASTSPLPAGTVSSPYSFTLQANGGSSPYTWSLAPGSLPAGLSLGTSTGTLSGTPSSPGTSNFVVTVHDNSGRTANGSFALTINSGLSITSTSPLTSGEVSRPYSFTFSGSGGSGSYTWSLPPSSIPPAGLTLNPGGTLSGTPTTAGTSSFLVQIADGSGSTATKTFQLQIMAVPSITTTSPLPTGTVNGAYGPLTFTESGGIGPFVWTSSSLPAGLSLTSGGVLSGTPTSAGTSRIPVTLTDAAGGTASAFFSLTVISALGITSSSPLPTGTVGSGYSFTFQASGGSGSYTWSVASGSLPAGLSLNVSSGVLSGTPSAAGNSSFGVSVHDGSGTATGSFALTINAGLSITSASPLTAGEVSRPYSFTFTGSGGSGSYTWSLPSGSSLPAGLTLNPGGTLGGTPTAAGTTSFSVQIADGTGHTATKAFQLQIVAAPSITTTSPLTSGTVNTGYGPLTLAESGGTAPFQWTSSALPAGLSLSSSGVLSGTPTSAGTTGFTVILTDAAGAAVSASLSLTIYSQLTLVSTSPLSAGTVNSPYSFTFKASGGSGSYTWSLASGSLPVGLSLNSGSGSLAGTPSAVGTSSFGVTVRDSTGATATGSFVLTVNNGLAISSASPITAAEVSRPYSFTFSGTGGSGSYTWSLPSGSSLPSGLTLSPGGTLGGTPTASGTASFSVQIADGTGNTATKAFQLQIVAAPSITTTSPLPAGTVNRGYSPFTLTESGGTAPFQWTSSALPAGLTLSSGGVVSGTPTSTGTSSISITLTDAAGATTSASFSLSVYSQLTISSVSPLPAGAVNSPYTFTFSAGGGSGSYTWSMSGSLPAGLSLNASSGILSGTPTAAGTSSFGIIVQDGSGTARGSFALTVNSGLSIISTSPLSTGEVSRPYSFTFTGTGGSGSYTWSLASGSSLPAGLNFTPGGTLNGTPTASGTTSFSVQFTDSAGDTVAKTFQVQILAAPSITTVSPLPTGTLNHAYSPLTFTESGGTAPFQWTSSGLPAGLNLSSGGVLSGTPTSAGTSSIAVTLTDAAGATASATFSLSIYSQLTIASASPLPAGAVNSPYSFTFQAGGGNGSYTWSVASGSLPSGFSLNPSTGSLFGTPSAAGTSNFVINVHDTSGGTATGSFALTINNSLSIASASILTQG